MTLSVGVAQIEEAMMGQEELIEAADQALYRAKHGGRNQVAWQCGDEPQQMTA